MMSFKKFTWISVGADLSRPAPIMRFHEIIRTSVGADLLRPAPIYRPLLGFRSPDEKVKTHSRGAFLEIEKALA